MITKEAFLNRHKHEFYGHVFDAIQAGKNRSGGELSMFMDLMQRKIDKRLREIYDGFVPPTDTPPPSPATGNGTNPPAQGVSNGERQGNGADNGSTSYPNKPGYHNKR